MAPASQMCLRGRAAPQQRRHSALGQRSSASGWACPPPCLARRRAQAAPRLPLALARSAPERVQQQQAAEQQLGPPAPPEQQQQQQQQQQHADASSSSSRQIITADAISTMQEEQEEQLKALTSDIPRLEQRFEWLAFWVAAAVAFGAGIWYVEGSEKAQEFFAGYLLEQSLSIDNLFVFVLVFNYFRTPLPAQPKVLTFGIATAAVLRLVMIMLGTELIQSFRPLLVGFALVLLWSAYGLLLKSDDDGDDDLSDNAVVRFCRRVLPVSDAYDGGNFFTTAGAGAAAGARVATPLLLTLAVVEISDVLFAVDSIPAVFGVTLDPFIVYTSNMFAILSLRSLYSFVSTVMTELRYLDKAVAIVLGFIGVKMLLEFAALDIPTDVSLLVVGLVLGGGVGASILLPEPEGDKEP